MYAICFLTIAMVGVDVGWQLVENGDLEYIIQIDPQQARSLKAGDVIEVGVRPQLRHVRRYRIVVGSGSLPRQSGEASAESNLVENQSRRATAPLENLGPSIVVPPGRSDPPEKENSSDWTAVDESGVRSPSTGNATIPTVPIDANPLSSTAEVAANPKSVGDLAEPPASLPTTPSRGEEKDASRREPRYGNLESSPPHENMQNSENITRYRYGDSVPIDPPGNLAEDPTKTPAGSARNEDAFSQAQQAAPYQIPLPPPPEVALSTDLETNDAKSSPDIAALGSDRMRSKETPRATPLPVTPAPGNHLGVVPATSQLESKANDPKETIPTADRLSATTSQDPAFPSEPSIANQASSQHELPLPVQTDQQKPWLPFTLTLCALFASLGGNLYLGWITWDIRNRFREIVGRRAGVDPEQPTPLRASTEPPLKAKSPPLQAKSPPLQAKS